ncbi:MAG: type ISP restriction/modification enzyme [Acidobacteriota bacterium]
MTDNGLDLRAVKTFPSLVKYLRDELDWPIESDDVEDLTFDYEPEELGLDAKTAVKIKEIKQLRPLASNQPWGIFFINFEPKQLPIVALRRILRALVFKKRVSGSRAQQKTWQLNDLLFISSYGDSSERAITLAHFSEDSRYGDLPTLRVLGWDAQDTVLHLEDAEQTLKAKLHWPDNAADVESWRSTWASAFTLRPREVVRTSRELAVKLADLATVIRERANKVLAIESASGPFRKLHQAFQEALIHDLSQDDFADMYAQTIAYGLLTAHVSRPAGLVAENIVDIVPNTNPFLKELLGTFLRVGGRKGKIDFDELGINEVVELLRNADMDAVLRDFGDRNPNEDPVIHFYELFLKEYDPVKRMKRGVFYTPRPVVSFIVRSVDEILRTEFGLEDGLADVTTWGDMAERNAELLIPEGVSPEAPFVQILDPATGTGTFLVEVIEVIHKTMVEKWRKQGVGVYDVRLKWDDYVQRDLLPRLYGFELMMAPYAIAHMKIGLKLRETGYSFLSSERARVYLTNTLEEPKDFSDYFEQMAPALAHEAYAANKIKRRNSTTVIIGNPPYAGHSTNTGQWINDLLRGKDTLSGEKTGNYFEVDGKRLDERNPKWLNDDYVKFMRYGQRRIEQSRLGVLAFITNHGYFDNPTFRGMRQSLLSTFSAGYVLDLHGNVKKGLRAIVDQNVFDIQQGVGIGIWVTSGATKAGHRVSHSEVTGDRVEKYQWLQDRTVLLNQYSKVEPSAPFYVFVPQEKTIREEFARGTSLVDVFRASTMGVTTGRDQLCISFTSQESLEKLADFTSDLPEIELANRYGLSNKSGWNIAKARRAIRSAGFSKRGCQAFAYRPFDVRVLYLDSSIVGRPRLEVMKQMLEPDNLGLCTTRQVNGEFRHVFCARCPTNDCLVSLASGERTYLFPLYSGGGRHGMLGHLNRESNLIPTFVKHFARHLGIQQEAEEGALSRDIFCYFYALLYSPAYRRRYSEFLKIEFPRVPLTTSVDLFRALACLGAELVSLHLLESPKLGRPLTTYTGPSHSEVEKVSYAGHTVWLDKAQTRGFKGVPESVWSFHVGGYQVCEKWLRDRRGRTLSDEDITHYQRVVVALNETIRLMGEIDTVIEEHGGWPLVGSQDVPKPSEPDQLPFS